jgi:Fe2+ or Zn2+ uptake regulation protein
MMRTTPQTSVITKALNELGHATNVQLLDKVKAYMPGMSATTVHRITTRLVEEGVIGSTHIVCAGSLVLDSNLNQHQHLRCEVCHNLQDIIFNTNLTDHVKKEVGKDFEITSLVINGICNKCKEII